MSIVASGTQFVHSKLAKENDLSRSPMPGCVIEGKSDELTLPAMTKVKGDESFLKTQFEFISLSALQRFFTTARDFLGVVALRQQITVLPIITLIDIVSQNRKDALNTLQRVTILRK